MVPSRIRVICDLLNSCYHRQMMPKWLARLGAAALLSFIFVPSLQAKILIYKAQLKASVFGEGYAVNVPVSGFDVIDADNHQSVTILFLPNQRYSIGQAQPFSSFEIQGPNVMPYLVIASAPDSPDTLMEYNWMRGAVSTVALSPTLSINCPRIFQVSGRALGVTAADNGTSIYLAGSGIEMLHVGLTRDSNAGSDSLADAVDRVSFWLQNHGWNEASDAF